MPSVQMCKQEDEYIENMPRWVVDLTNGERIWRDDGRPGVSPNSAWLRLKTYLKETETDIARMFIQFRSHLEFPLPENALGYFFCRKALAYLGNNVTIESFLVGFYDSIGEGVAIQDWQVPELIQNSIEYRPIQDIKPDCLILKQGIHIL